MLHCELRTPNGTRPRPPPAAAAALRKAALPGTPHWHHHQGITRIDDLDGRFRQHSGLRPSEQPRRGSVWAGRRSARWGETARRCRPAYRRVRAHRLPMRSSMTVPNICSCSGREVATIRCCIQCPPPAAANFAPTGNCQASRQAQHSKCLPFGRNPMRVDQCTAASRVLLRLVPSLLRWESRARLSQAPCNVASPCSPSPLACISSVGTLVRMATPAEET